jgi:hypothetical protein
MAPSLAKDESARSLETLLLSPHDAGRSSCCCSYPPFSMRWDIPTRGPARAGFQVAHVLILRRAAHALALGRRKSKESPHP